MSEDIAPAAETDTANSGEEQTWRSSLSEDIKDNATLAKYDSVEKLASAHINLQSHLGRDKIAKPVTDDDWDDVYNFLGRPESADAYQVDLPDEMPDFIRDQFNDETLGSFKSFAYEKGLNQEQVNALVQWQAQNMIGQHEKFNEMTEKNVFEAESALKKEWGAAYDQNLNMAKAAFSEFGGDELAALMEQSGLGNNPVVLNTFANIAKVTMPDKDLAGPTNQGQQALTPQEARDKAASFMAHPAYLDKNHAEHGKLVKDVQNLFQQAYGA